MSINFECKNRIKPKLLREQKTEALLVFIRTTLEQHFRTLKEQKEQKVEFGTKEDTQYIQSCLEKLLFSLQDCVVNASYLQSLIENSGKNRAIDVILLKEKPMMVYYDSIVKSIEKNLPQGSSWIPELMVLALLSQWILEEEKSTYLYPFLNDIDYIDLLARFDKAKQNERSKKDVVLGMYKLSTSLIESLKNSSYKQYKTKQTNKKNSRKKRR